MQCHLVLCESVVLAVESRMLIKPSEGGVATVAISPIVWCLSVHVEGIWFLYSSVPVKEVWPLYLSVPTEEAWPLYL